MGQLNQNPVPIPLWQSHCFSQILIPQPKQKPRCKDQCSCVGRTISYRMNFSLSMSMSGVKMHHVHPGCPGMPGDILVIPWPPSGAVCSHDHITILSSALSSTQVHLNHLSSPTFILCFVLLVIVSFKLFIIINYSSRNQYIRIVSMCISFFIVLIPSQINGENF